MHLGVQGFWVQDVSMFLLAYAISWAFLLNINYSCYMYSLLSVPSKASDGASYMSILWLHYSWKIATTGCPYLLLYLHKMVQRVISKTVRSVMGINTDEMMCTKYLQKGKIYNSNSAVFVFIFKGKISKHNSGNCYSFFVTLDD